MKKRIALKVHRRATTGRYLYKLPQLVASMRGVYRDLFQKLDDAKERKRHWWADAPTKGDLLHKRATAIGLLLAYGGRKIVFDGPRAPWLPPVAVVVDITCRNRLGREFAMANPTDPRSAFRLGTSEFGEMGSNCRWEKSRTIKGAFW